MAQWIARSTSNRKVVGSSPAGSSWFHGVMVSTRGFDPRNLGSIPSETYFLEQIFVARLAQLVERMALNHVVVGSSPTSGINYFIKLNFIK